MSIPGMSMPGMPAVADGDGLLLCASAGVAGVATRAAAPTRPRPSARVDSVKRGERIFRVLSRQRCRADLPGEFTADTGRRSGRFNFLERIQIEPPSGTARVGAE